MIKVQLTKKQIQDIGKNENKGLSLTLTYKQLFGNRQLYVSDVDSHKAQISLSNKKPFTIHLTPDLIYKNVQSGNLNDVNVKTGGFLPLAALIPLIASGLTAVAAGTAAGKNIRDLISGKGLFGKNEETIIQNLLTGLHMASDGIHLNPLALIPLLSGSLLAGTEVLKSRKGAGMPIRTRKRPAKRTVFTGYGVAKPKVKKPIKKKPSTKKTSVKKTSVKKTSAKKKTPAKKPPTKKASAKKKPSTKKESAKKKPPTKKPPTKRKSSKKPKITQLMDPIVMDPISGGSMVSTRRGGSMVSTRYGYGLQAPHRYSNP